MKWVIYSAFLTWTFCLLLWQSIAYKMNIIRFIFTFIGLSILLYLGLLWTGLINPPEGTPKEIEPWTYLVGILFTIIGRIDKLIQNFREWLSHRKNKGKLGLVIHVLDAKVISVKKSTPNFKGFVSSNGFYIQFDIENISERVVSIKDAIVYTLIEKETIEFDFARIYKIQPGYPNGMTIDPRPDLLEKIEPRESKTVRMNFSCNEEERMLKDEVKGELYLKLVLIDGKEHVTKFRLKN